MHRALVAAGLAILTCLSSLPAQALDGRELEGIKNEWAAGDETGALRRLEQAIAQAEQSQSFESQALRSLSYWYLAKAYLKHSAQPRPDEAEKAYQTAIEGGLLVHHPRLGAAAESLRRRLEKSSRETARAHSGETTGRVRATPVLRAALMHDVWVPPGVEYEVPVVLSLDAAAAKTLGAPSKASCHATGKAFTAGPRERVQLTLAEVYCSEGENRPLLRGVGMATVSGEDGRAGLRADALRMDQPSLSNALLKGYLEGLTKAHRQLSAALAQPAVPVDPASLAEAKPGVYVHVPAELSVTLSFTRSLPVLEPFESVPALTRPVLTMAQAADTRLAQRLEMLRSLTDIIEPVARRIPLYDEFSQMMAPVRQAFPQQPRAFADLFVPLGFLLITLHVVFRTLGLLTGGRRVISPSKVVVGAATQPALAGRRAAAGKRPARKSLMVRERPWD